MNFDDRNTFVNMKFLYSALPDPDFYVYVWKSPQETFESLRCQVDPTYLCLSAAGPNDKKAQACALSGPGA